MNKWLHDYHHKNLEEDTTRDKYATTLYCAVRINGVDIDSVLVLVLLFVYINWLNAEDL